jgi:LAS superfamily LD-carboxypeptidase LdcB
VVKTIRQESYWPRIADSARRIFEAERELITRCLTVTVLALLIGSASFMDARLQPQTAQARPRVETVKAGLAAEDQTEPADQGVPGLAPLAENTEGLNPELLQRFDAFRTFIFQQYGEVLEIRSGYRSYEQQAHLYRTLPRGRANPPGVSNHEKGEAIDYTNYGPTYNQHLADFGLFLPFPGVEDWHIERIELK